MTPEGRELARVRRRYRRLAVVYDLDPGERLLYARARRRAVELLRLSPGSAVLDVACGTGRNFPLLEERIGPSGRLVGVDLTSAMLARARSRSKRHGWSNVRLIEMDAAELSPERLEASGAIERGARFDAALSTLGLSAIPGWRQALDAILTLVRPGGWIAVMDGGYPQRAGDADEVTALRPFARMICNLAAADGMARPWLRLPSVTQETQVERFTWGYVGVAAGRRAPKPVQTDRDDHAPPAGAAVYPARVRVDVQSVIEIARPRDEVAAYASDPENATAWYENIKAVEWRSPKPVVVGSKVAFVARFLGRRLSYTYEVKEVARGERLVMRTAEGPFPMETIYTWEDTASGGTRMTLRNRGEPSGFARVSAPFVAAAVRRANRKDLHRLKLILERG